MDEFDKPIEATPPDNRRGVPGRRGASLGILHEWKARLKQIKGEIEAARTRPNYDPTSPVIKRWTDEQEKLETQIANAEEIREARRTHDAGRRIGFVSQVPSQPFTHSPDYTSITFQGGQHTLTPRQANVVRMLHEGYLQGTPELGTRHILEKLESETSRLRDTFKNSGLWGNGKLIIPGKRRGSVRLNLPDISTTKA